MDTKTVALLKKEFGERVAVAGDQAYDAASEMFAAKIKPGAVVRPQSSEDVARVVSFVKQHDTPFAIRSGGHGAIAARLADGILLVDMANLDSIKVIDKEQHLVRVGAGAVWQDVAQKLAPYGLGISSGDTGSVGVGGLATGPGIGWMVREYGLVIDNMQAAEVVTADGEVMQASANENSDLFWAIRGGGSNFGIVTHFDLVAHPVTTVFAGTITYPLANVGRTIKAWRDAMRQAPSELSSMLMTMPAFGGNPASAVITCCFDGADKAAADQALVPLRKLGDVTSDDIQAKPYHETLEQVHPPQDMRIITHNAFLEEFSDAAIDAIDQIFRSDQQLFLQIRHVAGAMNRLPKDESAFAFRNSEVLIVSPSFVAPDADSAAVSKATTAWRAIEPFGQGAYLNLLSEDTGKEVAQIYPPVVYKRLAAIKYKYDSDNIFKSNYNIKPSSN